MTIYIKNKGFTLIELLVVVAIISLLSSVVFASLNTARAKARDAKRKADLYEMRTAISLYYNTNGFLPGDANGNGNGYCSFFNNGAWGFAGSSMPAPLIVPTYISKIPTDPTSGADYVYYVINRTNGNFNLYAKLESTAGTPVDPCGYGTFNYTVSI